MASSSYSQLPGALDALAEQYTKSLSAANVGDLAMTLSLLSTRVSCSFRKLRFIFARSDAQMNRLERSFSPDTLRPSPSSPSSNEKLYCNLGKLQGSFCSSTISLSSVYMICRFAAVCLQLTRIYA